MTILFNIASAVKNFFTDLTTKFLKRSTYEPDYGELTEEEVYGQSGNPPCEDMSQANKKTQATGPAR